MTSINVVVKGKRQGPPGLDPTNIPAWIDDTSEIGPCPCGDVPDNTVLLIEGRYDLKRWFHRRCLEWLVCDWTEDEFEQLQEWKNHVEKEE